ncbi:MAG: hypothetical protein NZ927_06910 [Candidatus Calescibacterium sp.]|nr:hypothetical protein [Candidatus Calescibacterium sp.]MCX7734523.1 hypothetical protein [bacterium]MDW8087652.1 hypothetical protein [Candidatus Calescibacterium sp.]
MFIQALLLINFQFDIEGYLRTRGKLFSNISLVEIQGLDPLFTYLDSRAMIKTSLGTEDLKLMGRFDLLDNVVWGYNVRGASDSPLAETISFNDIVGQDVPPIRIRRLYIQGLTKIGLFMIGFVPSHWGLGMSVNSGDGIYDDFGDTFARILFATKPLGQDSNLITAVFINKSVEGAVVQEGSSDILDADTDDFGVAILYDTKQIRGGAYTTLRTQYASDSRAFFSSLYSEVNIGNFYFAEEVAGLFGSFTPYKDQTLDVNSIGAVARLGYKIDSIFPVFEFGYASPPGDDEFDFDINRRGRQFRGFTFDANYRPALILFQFVGGKKLPQPWQKGYTNVLESRRVWSATYTKLSVNIKTTSVVVIPSFIFAWDSKSGKSLGFEPDFEVRSYLLKEKREIKGDEEINNSLFLSLRVGYLFATEKLREIERPGERGVRKSNPFAVVGLIAYEF